MNIHQSVKMETMDTMTCHISNVILTCCLLTTLCECLGEKKNYTREKNDMYNHNITLNKLNVSMNTNKTNTAQVTKDFRYRDGMIQNTNGTNVTETEKITDTTPKQSDDTPLPIPIMVASPAVAVGIFIFICVAYKWHTVQLDAQAKDLAAQMVSGHCPSPCIPCSPCHNTHRLLPPSNSMNSTSQYHSDSDLFGARRKSLRTPSPILLAPPGLGSHRGSSWSALADQEVISHSPRRHSTFLL